MWTRSELKMKAKQVLARCFVAAVVVCLISSLLAGEFGERGSAADSNHSNSGNTSYVGEEIIRDLREFDTEGIVERGGVAAADLLTNGLTTLLLSMGIFIFIIGTLITIFIGYPILVGSKRFFMSSREGQGNIGDVLYGFGSGHVLNIVFVQFLQFVKTVLWYLLLVIPGVVKGYEYMMIPYILSENPSLGQKRAFELSRAMMTGQKWDAFVLDLSFLLWHLLGSLTCGLVSVLYVNPYKAATRAELYAVLREDLLQRGFTNTYELPGFESQEGF